MTALYNENEPYAAEWLGNLIEAGHIASGEVDDRGIEDLTPEDINGATQFHAFAGIGVWSHALRLAGWSDDAPVWTGSCPCQPFSSAGKRGGFDDERHLWPAWFDLIRECRPATIFGEQVAGPAGLAWLDAVLGDLEGIGYACGAADLAAASVGAPHIRQRLFFVAHANKERRYAAEPATRTPRVMARQNFTQDVERNNGQDRRFVPDAASSSWSDLEWLPCTDGKARPTQPGIFPLVDGAPARVGRLRAYGNAIVAPLAAEFIRAVNDEM